MTTTNAPRRPPRRGRRLVTCVALAGTLAASTQLAVAETAPGDTTEHRAEVRRTLEVALGDDGSTVETILHTDTEGSVTSEPVDVGTVPVAVLVRYRLDGRTVDAETFRGGSGEAVIAVEVRNLTAEPRRFEVDGPDGSRMVERQVPVPLHASARLHLGDGWRHVDAPTARVSADTEIPGTRVDWDAPLFPPTGTTKANFEVRGEVDGADAPTLHLDVTPVTSDSSPVLATAAQLLEDRAVVDAVAAFFTTALRAALDASAEGATALADALRSIADGLDDAAAPDLDLDGLLDDLDLDPAALLDDLDLGLEDLEQLAELADGLDPQALLDELLADLDLDAVLADLLGAFDPDTLLADLDPQALLDGLDLAELLGDVFDPDAALGGLDLDALLEEVLAGFDPATLVGELDLEQLVRDLDLGGLLADAFADLDVGAIVRDLLDTSTIAAELERIEQLLDRLTDPEDLEIVAALRAAIRAALEALAQQTAAADQVADELAAVTLDDASLELVVAELVAALDEEVTEPRFDVDEVAALFDEVLALLRGQLGAVLDALPPIDAELLSGWLGLDDLVLPPLDELLEDVDLDALLLELIARANLDARLAELLDELDLGAAFGELDLAALLEAAGFDPAAAIDEDALEAAFGAVLAALTDAFPDLGLPQLDTAELLELLDLDGLDLPEFDVPDLDPEALLAGLEFPDLEELFDLDALADEFGLDELEAAFDQLQEGLLATADGGDDLAEGLGDLGEEGLGQLLDQLDADADEAREDLALLDVLDQRVDAAATSVGGTDASRHLRFELTVTGDHGGFPLLPVGALGLALLGAAGELARRRWLA